MLNYIKKKKLFQHSRNKKAVHGQKEKKSPQLTEISQWKQECVVRDRQVRTRYDEKGASLPLYI